MASALSELNTERNFSACSDSKSDPQNNLSRLTDRIEAMKKLAHINKMSKMNPNLESLSVEVYQSIFTLSGYNDKKYIALYLMLRNGKVRLKLDSNEVILNTNIWVFRVLVVTSTRIMRLMYEKRPDQKNQLRRLFVRQLIRDIFFEFRPLDYRSIFLVKHLEQIITKRADVLQPEDFENIALQMSPMYASPHVNIVHLALKIKGLIKGNFRPGHVKNPLNNMMLLLRYPDCAMFLNLYDDKQIFDSVPIIMDHVCVLFKYKAHGQRASELFKQVVLLHDFDEFKEKIWKHWEKSLELVDDQGDFFQCIIKYWIPTMVTIYRKSLFFFITEQDNVDKRIQVEILYALRKRKMVEHTIFTAARFHREMIYYLNDRRTLTLLLKAMCIFHRYTEYLHVEALINFEKFIKIQTNLSLDHDFFKEIMTTLVTHIMYSEHYKKLCNPKYAFEVYDNFMQFLCQYAIGTLKHERKFEVGAELLAVLIECTTSSCQKLDLQYEPIPFHKYPTYGNFFYKHLEAKNHLTFFTTEREQIMKFVTLNYFKRKGLCQKTAFFLKNYVIHFVDLKHFLIPIQREQYMKSALRQIDIFKSYYNIVLPRTNQVSPEKFTSLVRNMVVESIVSIRELKVTNETTPQIFHVLVRTIIFLLGDEVRSIEKLIYPFVQLALDFVVHVVVNGSHEELEYRNKKVFEAFVTHILELMCRCHKEFVPRMEDLQIYQKLTLIIQRCNLKKAVTTAIHTIKVLSAMMDSNVDAQEFKVAYLVNLLDTVPTMVRLPQTRLRKHPETTSVIHAICVGQKEDSKVFVKLTARRVLQFLGDRSTSRAGTILSLGCLEYLMNEATFFSHTVQFIELSIIVSIMTFASDCWEVRNAALQSTKVLINRCLGNAENCTRTRSLLDMCLTYPVVIDYFTKVLRTMELTEEAILVLQYISESQLEEKDYLNDYTRQLLGDYFSMLFYHILRNEGEKVKFVIPAYVALCLEQNVPVHVVRITNFIIEKYTALRRNIFRNLLALVQQLIMKFQHSFTNLIWPIHNRIISLSLLKLHLFLSQRPNPVHDFLHIPHLTISFIMISTKQMARRKLSWFDRVWLNNNLHHMIKDIRIDHLASVLYKMLDNRLPIYCHEIMLIQAVKRINELKFSNENTSKVLFVLLSKFILFNKKTNDLMYKLYTEAILSVFEKTDCDLIKFHPELLLCYKTEFNVYRVVVYTAAVYRCSLKEKEDLAYIEKCYDYLERIATFNEYQHHLVVRGLKYMIRTVTHKKRSSFIRIVIYLMVRDYHEEDICKFASDYFNRLITPPTMFITFINISFLTIFFPSKQMITDCLRELTSFLNRVLTSPNLVDSFFEIDYDLITFYIKTIGQVGYHLELMPMDNKK